MTKDDTQKTAESLVADLPKLAEDFSDRLDAFLMELPAEFQTAPGGCLLLSVMLSVAASGLREIGVPEESIRETFEDALDGDDISFIVRDEPTSAGN